MSNIWFTSDTHYNHTNICYGVSKWDDKEKSSRKFNTLNEMNDAIVNSINKYVQQEDILYFLGDWSFGGIENIYLFWKRLICKNIRFISGNHDHHIKKNRILPNVKRIKPYSADLIDGEPISGEYPDYVESQRLFKEYLPELITITINKQKIYIMSLPFRTMGRYG